MKNMKPNPRLITPKRWLPRLRIAGTAVLVLTAAAMALSAADSGTGNSSGKSKNGVYIVQMRHAPALTYKGGVAGYKATAPKRGQKIDPLAADTVRYVDYLEARHNDALAKIGGGSKLYDYAFSYNGFAARLSA